MPLFKRYSGRPLPHATFLALLMAPIRSRALEYEVRARQYAIGGPIRRLSGATENSLSWDECQATSGNKVDLFM